MTPLLRAAFWAVIAIAALVYRKGKTEMVAGAKISVKRESRVLAAIESFDRWSKYVILAALLAMAPKVLFDFARFLIGR